MVPEAKWSPARQTRIDELMELVHQGSTWIAEEPRSIQ
jgi:hypothetical protein